MVLFLKDYRDRNDIFIGDEIRSVLEFTLITYFILWRWSDSFIANY